MTRRGLGALLAWALALPVQAAALAATVTIVDGEAVLLRGVAKAALAEGVRLAAGDIVETTAAARLLRLELDDGLAVDLGPASRLQLGPRLAGEATRRVAPLYLLRGWAKLSAVAGEAAPQLLNVYSGSLLQQGALVAFVGNGQAWVFDESGAPQVMERPARGSPMTLASGQFYTRTGSNPGQVLARAPAEALREVPRAFRDTLPRRHAQVVTKPVAAQPQPQPSFDEVQEWLRGESALRRFMATHFAHWARDASFHAALLAAPKDFPEWANVLHPPKAKRP